MKINLTKLARYQPLSKSKKGQELLFITANEFDTTPEYIMRLFVRYLGALIVHRIQQSVKTQTINGRPMKLLYKPLSEKYNNSKPAKFKDKFWINSDFLIKNLQMWQLKSGDLYIGYRHNRIHPKSKTTVRDIMMFVERGTKNMPPRPLFTIIVRGIAKNITSHLERFIMGIQQGKVRV